jgi:D-serine deaminase-like pyridoxal phosphate-dependent protein
VNQRDCRAPLARLARALNATIGLLVDDAANVRHLGAAARAAGVILDVLVEIDVGMHRCGVAPGASAAALAELVARTPALRFRGVHAYHGSAQHLRAPADRQAAVSEAVRLAHETKAAIEAAGVACPVVTGAGTGTWQHERDSGVYTELQPGSYIFMDADYHRNALASDEHDFEQSLYVVATVMSAPVRERAVVDAGLKAFAFDSGLPQVWGAPGLDYVKAADEHGVLTVAADREPLQPGDRVWLIRDTAIRRSISTTGSSACAARASSACGRSRRAGRWADQRVTRPRGVRSIAASRVLRS